MFLIALVLVVARIQLQTEAGRDFADKIKLKIPVLGGILMNLAVARFCRVLGTLLGNGVPILKSLDISGTAAGNRLLQASVSSATENIKSGESLAGPLRGSGYFPPTVVEMISVGEESNSLDTVLPDIADSLEKTTFSTPRPVRQVAGTYHAVGDGRAGSGRRVDVVDPGIEEQHHGCSGAKGNVRKGLGTDRRPPPTGANRRQREPTGANGSQQAPTGAALRSAMRDRHGESLRWRRLQTCESFL